MRPKNQYLLLALILSSGIVFLDSSVVNVALPAIDRGLHVGLSGLQWVIDGYILSLAALLILGGSLGDIYGHRRIMIIGLSIFGASSAACGLAPTGLFLILTRLVQGVGGALLIPGSLAVIRSTYPKGEQRGKAIGIWSGWAGITTVIGPLLGGWLVDALSWRWVFFINLPLIMAAIWMVRKYVPLTGEKRKPSHLDWQGGIIAICAFAGIAYALIEGPVAGWTSPQVIIAAVLGIGALGTFPLIERKVRDPMVPMDLFRSRNFSGANITTLGIYFGLYGMSFFLVIYLQNVMGVSAFVAGMMVAPASLLLLALSSFVGKVAGKIGPRWFLTAGPLVCALGLLVLVLLQPDSDLWIVLGAIAIFGVGLSFTVAPLTNTILSAVSDAFAALAAAINNVVSRAAALVAIAGLGVVVTVAFNDNIENHVDKASLDKSSRHQLQQLAHDPTGTARARDLPEEIRNAVNVAYTHAFHWAIVLCAAISACAGVVAAFTIQNSS